MRKIINVLIIVSSIVMLSGCGLAERRHEKIVFEEYPTLPGDEMVEIHNIVHRGGVVDSTIVVKNGEDYFIVRKDGSRQPAKRFTYRK